MLADSERDSEPSEQGVANGGSILRPEAATPRDLVQQAIDSLDHGEPGAAKRILLRLLQEI
jgi:hypothetical protein